MRVNSISRCIINSLNTADNYQLASGLFLKLLAIIYFAAFFSLGIQITGLVGANGILPVNDLLDYLYQNNGALAWLYKPTLFWFESSDFALQGAAVLGCIASLLLFIGYKPVWSLLVLFILYLSLFHAGQTFLMFQWDTLLLEAGFLAMFLSGGPSHLLIFLFHWLLFRLRFMSGVSKLSSDDPSWSSLTTLNYYFETQPLAHAGAWYFHQLPEWMLQGGVLLIFFSELIVPFFIFLSRKFRLFAAAFTIVIQLLIIASSNHNWINLLTIVLCLFLLDDNILRKILPRPVQALIALRSEVKDQQKKTAKRRYPQLLLAMLIIISSASSFTAMLTNGSIAGSLASSTVLVRLWGLGHMFHIFPTMQTQRHELQIEGSYDAKEWKAYVFKYKPGPLERKPPFIVPHQPRLDWMIWFVPPRHADMRYWFDQFLFRLQQGSAEVLALLEYNPFPDKPPSYIRVQVYQYHFTTLQQRNDSGEWWRREYLGMFPNVPPRYP